MLEAIGSQLNTVLLAEIDAVKARRAFQPFPAGLEALFERETGAGLAKILSKDLWLTAVFYNLMLAGDVLLTPDMLAWAAALHFLFVTPVILAAAGFIRRGLPPLARDLAGAAGPLLICGQILAIFAMSRAENASFYLFLVVLNVATFNGAMRMRYRAATWFTYASYGALPATLAAVHKLPIQVEAMLCFSLIVCGTATLKGARSRDQYLRRAFLSSLRARVLLNVVDAQASHDALTGALNRRGLDAAVAEIWRKDDGATCVAAILFDIDRFKAFNDLYGHPAGDACLKAVVGVANALCESRKGAVARFGGEEFLVLLTGTAAARADAFAEELRAAILNLRIPHASGVERGFVSASFGVARAWLRECDFEALTAAADQALYRAKAAGRNKVEAALAAA